MVEDTKSVFKDTPVGKRFPTKDDFSHDPKLLKLYQENEVYFQGQLIPDLDQSHVEIFGNPNDEVSKQLIFAIKRCQINCAPENEIDEYIETLVILGIVIEP